MYVTFNYVDVCMSGCGLQIAAVDCLEQELQRAVSCLTWVLQTKLWKN